MTACRIATWNVNSLNVRLPHVLDWLVAEKPQVLCLQETKLEDHRFPFDALREAGYHAIHSGQKTYNGVAVLATTPPAEVIAGIPGFDDPQRRVLAATVGDLRVICTYFPNGQAVGSEKYAYKLRWLAALRDWLSEEIAAWPRLALLGDFNIAPEDRDVHDPEAWRGQILCSDPERQAFRSLVDLGLQDAFRRFEAGAGLFSWWDYRQAAFRRNLGLRIDHILLSPPVSASCTGCRIDTAPRRLERPSDHAPVVADLA